MKYPGLPQYRTFPAIQDVLLHKAPGHSRAHQIHGTLPEKPRQATWHVPDQATIRTRQAMAHGLIVAVSVMARTCPPFCCESSFFLLHGVQLACWNYVTSLVLLSIVY